MSVEQLAEMDKRADALIGRWSLGALAGNLMPPPIDTAMVAAAFATMGGSLAKVYQVEVDRRVLKDLGRSVIAGVGAGELAAYLGTSALKYIPGVNLGVALLIQPPIVGAITFTAGHVFKRYFRVRILEGRELTKEEAKSLANEALKDRLAVLKREKSTVKSVPADADQEPGNEFTLTGASNAAELDGLWDEMNIEALPLLPQATPEQFTAEHLRLWVLPLRLQFHPPMDLEPSWLKLVFKIQKPNNAQFIDHYPKTESYATGVVRVGNDARLEEQSSKTKGASLGGQLKAQVNYQESASQQLSVQTKALGQAAGVSYGIGAQARVGASGALGANYKRSSQTEEAEASTYSLQHELQTRRLKVTSSAAGSRAIWELHRAESEGQFIVGGQEFVLTLLLPDSEQQLVATSEVKVRFHEQGTFEYSRDHHLRLVPPTRHELAAPVHEVIAELSGGKAQQLDSGIRVERGTSMEFTQDDDDT